MPTFRSKSTRPRIRHLRNKHAAALRTMAAVLTRRRRLYRGDTAAFDYLVAFDPTPEGIYVGTIVKWMRTNRIRFEDGRRVRDTLQRFHDRKHRLPEDQRDIGAYQSPGAIDRLFEDQTLALPISVPEEIMADCVLEGSGDDWMLVKVTTTAAAVWWADSTSWCTRHVDQALDYLEDGFLYVLASPRGRLQFHLSNQLMDRWDEIPTVEDLPVPPEALRLASSVARRDRRGSPYSYVTVEGALDDLAAGRDPETLRSGKRIVQKENDVWQLVIGWEEVFDYFDIRNAETGKTYRIGGIDDWASVPIDAQSCYREYLRHQCDAGERDRRGPGEIRSVMEDTGAFNICQNMHMVFGDGPDFPLEMMVGHHIHQAAPFILDFRQGNTFFNEIEPGFDPATADPRFVKALHDISIVAMHFPHVVAAVGEGILHEGRRRDSLRFGGWGSTIEDIVSTEKRKSDPGLHVRMMNAVLARSSEWDMESWRTLEASLFEFRGHWGADVGEIEAMLPDFLHRIRHHRIAEGLGGVVYNSDQDAERLKDAIRNAAHIPGSGQLVSLLPDAFCTEEFIDEMIDLGCGDALFTAPSRFLLSEERLGRALDTVTHIVHESRNQSYVTLAIMEQNCFDEAFTHAYRSDLRQTSTLMHNHSHSVRRPAVYMGMKADEKADRKLIWTRSLSASGPIGRVFPLFAGSVDQALQAVRDGMFTMDAFIDEFACSAWGKPKMLLAGLKQHNRECYALMDEALGGGDLEATLLDRYVALVNSYVAEPGPSKIAAGGRP